MPIWRDPLDELIADLERTVPQKAAATFEVPPSMTDHCFLGEWLLERDPARRAQLAEDPRVKRVQAYYDRWAARLGAARQAATDSGGSQG